MDHIISISRKEIHLWSGPRWESDIQEENLKNWENPENGSLGRNFLLSHGPAALEAVSPCVHTQSHHKPHAHLMHTPHTHTTITHTPQHKHTQLLSHPHTPGMYIPTDTPEHTHQTHHTHLHPTHATHITHTPPPASHTHTTCTTRHPMHTHTDAYMPITHTAHGTTYSLHLPGLSPPPA